MFVTNLLKRGKCSDNCNYCHSFRSKDSAGGQ